MMKLLVADDHKLVLVGIRRALADTPDIEIVGEARKGSHVLPMVNRLRPDVVLLDIRLPEMDGIGCLELIRKKHPQTKVIMLSAYDDADHIEGALSRGAAGYIVKSINPYDLASAIRQAVEGTVFHALGLSRAATNGSGPGAPGLTERELVILRAVARGLSNRAIGKELWVTEQTVKFHLTNIYRKLDVANRTEAARAAYRLGVAESPAAEAT
jgi:DNA-binding NarL/FixJ family response regulator